MEDYKRINLDSYEENAETFEKYFKGLFDLDGRVEFKKFINFLHNGDKILDIGCGGGDHSLWFKEQGLDVTALDFSPKMVEFTRKKGVNAVVMDLENMSFEDNEFNGIWAVTSLLHTPKEKMNSVIRKMSEILKPEGVLFIALKEGVGEKLLMDNHNPDTKRFFVFWKEDEIKNYFGEFFEVIESWIEKTGQTDYINVFFRNKKSS
ncbi:hypothetical protein COU60_05365 [Candidatus Pacearchaeota archaeon CG10_big_fil_rev_8_21_14_0_10_34_76]|nr:MAG: hypothetical protein COU60_05365 [Candidatus Pacearchaeota archaeon CG10_big_fil_rev_8_21_14_0_10_34_76]